MMREICQNGAAALITSQFPFALYVHCASHSLNLTVVSSLEEVRVNRASIFFSAHRKRQKKLEEAIENTQPESHVRKLKDLCRPRWIKRIDALDRFQVLHSSVVMCIEMISAEGTKCWSTDSVTDASTLLLAITTTDFMSSLVITTACLKYLLGLTRSLQAETKDIVQAMSEVRQ